MSRTFKQETYRLRGYCNCDRCTNGRQHKHTKRAHSQEEQIDEYVMTEVETEALFGDNVNKNRPLIPAKTLPNKNKKTLTAAKTVVRCRNRSQSSQ